MPSTRPARPPAVNSPTPNVLFIIADDHRHDAFGAGGNPTVQTPTLDALAARGARFTHAYQMGGLIPAVCSPARASLLTGCNVITANAKPVACRDASATVTIPARLQTLPELFRRAGYETFITGKWHNDTAALQRSFTGGRRIFLGGMSDHRHVPLRDYSLTGDYTSAPYFETGFSSDLFCATAREFVAQSSQPFFLYLSLTSPHDPRTPPGNYARLYPTEQLSLPPNFQPHHPFDNGELAIRDELLAAKPLCPADLRQELARYYGMISHQDAQLGRVVAALRNAGLESNTLIVYVSDHGLALGSHGLLGKQNLYEPSVRVPLLLSGPGVATGTRCDQLVYSLDLFATLAELCGITVPASIDSRSLLPGDHFPRTRENVFAMYKDCQRMVRDDRWKLIRYRVAGQERTQLFDLKTDPHELTDLANDTQHQHVVRRLCKLIGAWQQKVGDRWMPAPALV